MRYNPNITMEASVVRKRGTHFIMFLSQRAYLHKITIITIKATLFFLDFGQIYLISIIPVN